MYTTIEGKFKEMREYFMRKQAGSTCRHCNGLELILDHKSRLIKKLEKKIHNQRLALRENWIIVESRQKYRKTPLRTMWFDKCIAMGKEVKMLRDKVAVLIDTR